MSESSASDLDVVAAEILGDDTPLPVAEAAHACDSCGCPLDSDDSFCPACGNRQQPESAKTSPHALPRSFRCEQCGAEVAVELDQRSYVCPFCDSTFVIELPGEATRREEPEFVIPFGVTAEKAADQFRQWLKRRAWYRPRDLTSSAATDKLKGVYLPFWSFSVLAESRWSATIGEYWYRTETYWTTDSKGKRVRRTRRVRETEWWPLSGRYHSYHRGHLVSGSGGLSQSFAEKIKPFRLESLKRYHPRFLAGWLCEEYSVDREEAWRLSREELLRRQQHAVAEFLPGNTHRDLNVATEFRHRHSDLCLLPIYLATYKYRGKVYRFLMNGQTGKFWGEKPVSWRRVATIVLSVIAGLLIVGLLILWLAHNV